MIKKEEVTVCVIDKNFVRKKQKETLSKGVFLCVRNRKKHKERETDKERHMDKQTDRQTERKSKIGKEI